MYVVDGICVVRYGNEVGKCDHRHFDGKESAKRWELLKVLCDAGPVSIREAARRVGRDVKAVHSDITALLNAGVLDRAEGGGIIFPFEAVKVEFLLQAA